MAPGPVVCAVGAHVVVGLGVGGREHERADAIGVADGQLLRDHSAHAQPEDVRAPEAARVHHRDRVVGERAHVVRAGRLVAAPDAAVVVDADAMRAREHRRLELPELERPAEAHDEQQRIAVVAVALVVEVDAVARGRGHAGKVARA